MNTEKLANKIGALTQLMVEEGMVLPLTFNSFRPDEIIVHKRSHTIRFPWGRDLRMDPVEMTLYVFFLAHPAGIMKEELWGYYTELLKLYRRFALSSDPDWTESVIDNICDTENNDYFLVRLSRLRLKMVKNNGELFASRFAISRNDRGIYRITTLIQ